MKAMENNRLTVLAPYQSGLPSSILKPQLFDVRIYKTAEDAWRIAEQEQISLFISSEDFISSSPAGLVTALCGLHPEMVHLFLYTAYSAEELATVVNASCKIHIAKAEAPKDALIQAATNAMNLYLKGAKKNQLIADLTEQNEQYEFMLRQSLLS